MWFMCCTQEEEVEEELIMAIKRLKHIKSAPAPRAVSGLKDLSPIVEV